MTKIFSPISHCIFIVMLAAGTVFTESCSKTAGGRTQTTPQIDSFTPLSAAKDSIVVINGTNFSPVPANNIVTFNGVIATVVAATATRIEVKVPLRAGNGEIKVKIADRITSSIINFTYLLTANTLAGSVDGFANGTGNEARFSDAFGVTTDANGNIIVADGNNNRIRKITPQGIVSTIAGDGSIGTTNGPAANARFNFPRGVAVDNDGNIYVADAGNNLIRKISTTGMVSTLAGDGTQGLADGPGATAKLNFPVDLVTDENGNIYVTDGGNQRVRKITAAGVVSTFGGTQFGFPEGIVRDRAGNLYIADPAVHRIFKINTEGAFSTVAGTGIGGFTNGAANIAQFLNPEGIAIDTDGNLYVGDLSNAAIRKITPQGLVSTLAGGARGFADGLITNAKFHEPSGITVDNLGNIYIADVRNSRIRRIQ